MACTRRMTGVGSALIAAVLMAGLHAGPAHAATTKPRSCKPPGEVVAATGRVVVSTADDEYFYCRKRSRMKPRRFAGPTSRSDRVVVGLAVNGWMIGWTEEACPKVLAGCSGVTRVLSARTGRRRVDVSYAGATGHRSLAITANGDAVWIRTSAFNEQEGPSQVVKISPGRPLKILDPGPTIDGGIATTTPVGLPPVGAGEVFWRSGGQIHSAPIGSR